MKIQFCGAAQEVTGSAHLITLENNYKILLDCGLYQGYSDEMENFNRNWAFEPSEVDCLLLSHAHIDHSGRIPKLVKDGFRGQIICTHATRSLCAVMLADSARIQERDAEYHNRKNKDKGKTIEPLYRSADVRQAMNRFVGLGYDIWHEITPGVKVIFRDAGHILGSANVTLEVDAYGSKRRIGFTGDIGRPERPILRDPQPMPEVDFLISESTYGNKEHEAPPKESERLLSIIKQVCVEQKGKLLIPAFSVGRTQEIVYMMDQMANAGQLPKIPVYVDSPMAVNATTVFGSHPECYDSELNEYMLSDYNPFGFNGLRYVHDVKTSKSLNNSKEPSVIISAAGMMNAGRSKHHLRNTMTHSRNGILIVGYCTPHTPGGALRDGAKKLTLFGERLPVKAKVFVMDSFSAHGDRREMADFMENQKKRLRKMFLVHGTLDRQQAFRDYLGERGFDKENIEIPELGQTFRL